MNKTVTFTLNGKKGTRELPCDQFLLEALREMGCKSVKRGCETSACGLCTVWLDEKPVLSCTTLAVRADGHRVTTLEGLQDEARVIGGYLADEGGEQCGFCSPGLIMNILSMEKAFPGLDPTEAEIRHYLEGNLCRCSGYESHIRAVTNYFAAKRKARDAGKEETR